MDKREKGNTELNRSELMDILLALSTFRGRTEAAGYDAQHIRRLENRVRMRLSWADLDGLRQAS